MTTLQAKPRLWSREEYYLLADQGMFRDQRVELIGGEVIQMPAQRNSHVYSVTRVADLLRKVFGPSNWVRVQAPLSCGGASEPEPDVAVVSGPPVNSPQNPATALIVVEVSDTTLRYDRGDKGSLYARQGIADYWIVNLEEGQLEIYREPVPDDRSRFGWRYQTVSILQKGQLASPLARAEAKIAVSEMLP